MRSNFRDDDILNINIDDILLDRKLMKSIEMLKLDKKDILWLKELNGNPNVKKKLKEFPIEIYVGKDVESCVSNYIRNILNPKFITVKNRINLIFCNGNLSLSMNDHIKLIDDMGDYIIDFLIDVENDKSKVAYMIKVINKLINLDISILWRVFEEINIKKDNKVNDDFRKAMGLLPNMVYRLRKYIGESSFKVDYCEGSLIDELGFGNVEIVGKYIDELFDFTIIDKLRMYLESAIYNDLAEFTIVREDRTLRNVLSAERKTINGEEFIEIVGYTSDITQLNKSEEKIKKLAYYDSLTGLPNRELFYKKLNDWMDIGDPNKVLGILFIDVDDFKFVNDTLGHYAGDQLLIEIAKRLRESVRSGDIVARLAGDEFTVICTSVKMRKDLKIIVERIIESIAEVPFQINGNSIKVTLSIGVAIYPYDGTDVDTILNNADVAMYKAKNSGKNNYRFFEDSMNSEAITKLQIQNDLRKAIQREEFYLDYQLQFDSVKNKIVGMEALLRWNHPEKGFVSPGEFIEVAENSGIIVEMGYWVLREGCSKLKQLRDEGYNNLVLGINFSALQFMQRDLVDQVKAILYQYDVPAHSLMLEITESTSMGDVESTISILKSLRKLGVLISIDDFGTGYSSLSYLREFPLTNLKIDQSFVHELGNKKNDTQLVKSIIALANSLELDVVAEGVETKSQYDILKNLGCTKFQGYYFGEPVSFEKLRASLQDNGGFK